MNNSPPIPQNCLHQLFEQQVVLHPQNIALFTEKEQLTYLELDQQANQLARRLQNLGIKRGDCIGLLLERGLSTYIALLAILKAGAAYVPLDPNYPAERIHFILTDCQINLLITTSHIAVELPTFDCQYLMLDQEKAALKNESVLPVQLESISADNLCYIIYTSGSTGKPKGVAIPHHAVCNYIHAAQQAYGINNTDRVYQGFSISFDASVEEIWLTLASGATLIPGIDNALHAGAGLVEFLAKNQITFLSCVPTLLTMLEPPVPSLRLMVLGGEVCPKDLIKRWSRPGLRILNTYGPTEATVVTTYAECDPEKPITIGRPLTNYEIYILNEKLELVQIGEEGELCIGGDCLASGYINRSDLNASKFIIHPQLNKRLYRSGDLGRMLANGEIQFTGRLDGQIKLRGYRIELAEIEAVLNQYPGVHNAVVATWELTPGVQSLVGYLILDQKTNIKLDQLPAYLHDLLPEYMVPSIFEVLEKLPLLASGKVDRKQLPKPQMHHDQINNNYLAPVTEHEKKLVCVFEELFQHSPLSITADFFHDLGGHSLLAAKAVSQLRKDKDFKQISILDIYENPTIKKLATKIALSNEQSRLHANTDTNRKQRPQQTKLQYYCCAVAQAFGGYLQFSIQAWEFLLIVSVLTYTFDRFSLFSLKFFTVMIALLIGLPLTLFAISIIAKWVLLGKIKAGEYPLWSSYYFRWWLCNKINLLTPISYLVGTPFINIYYRLMGAQIGKDCYIATPFVHSYDLLTIGDHTSIGHDARLLAYTVENGWLKIGAIKIGDECFIGAKSVISHNTIMENQTTLEDFSMLSENQFIAYGQHYHGSPARPCVKEQNNNKINIKDDKDKNYQYLALHICAILFTGFIYYSAYIPAIILIDYLYLQSNLLSAILIGIPLGALLFISLLCIETILAKKLLLGKMLPGAIALKSIDYIKAWIVERLLSTPELAVLGDSLYLPVFLRLMGAKIGKRVEIGEMPYIMPDLLTLEDESFIASGVFMGAPRVFAGMATYSAITIGKRAFVGNDSVLPPGTKLGSGSLIACLSIPPENNQAEKANSSWLGSPAVNLPKREIFTGFSDKEIFHPPLGLYLKRLAIEFIRIILPSIFSFFSLVALFSTVDYLSNMLTLKMTILLFPIFYMMIAIGMTMLGIGLKWLLMGKMQETIKPVWSTFVWKYDIIVWLYINFLENNLEPFLGTPFAAIFLRLMGAKVGKNTFIDTKNFTEFDLIEIGDHAALNAFAVIQTHLYEDRIFKMSHIKIENGCNIGCDAVVLYNTVMEENSSLGNLSLLMKGEHLPAASRWEGSPAQAVRYIPQAKTSTEGEENPVEVYNYL